MGKPRDCHERQASLCPPITSGPPPSCRALKSEFTRGFSEDIRQRPVQGRANTRAPGEEKALGKVPRVVDKNPHTGDGARPLSSSLKLNKKEVGFCCSVRENGPDCRTPDEETEEAGKLRRSLKISPTKMVCVLFWKRGDGWTDHPEPFLTLHPCILPREWPWLCPEVVERAPGLPAFLGASTG